MNKKPLVSVIMPVFNAGEFLVEALESMVHQTYRNFELIIVDDASTDNSWQVITKYRQRYDKKIRAFRVKKQLNKGGDACANEGFRRAKGELIARMDADDVARKDRLERQVRFLQENPEIDVLGSSAVVIDREGRKVGVKRVPLSHKEIYGEFFVFNPLIHPTVMVRRKIISPYRQLYRINYEANNDYLTFFEWLGKGVRFANLKARLIKYRIHSRNDSLHEVRGKFRNSLKIRYRAVTEFGYVPNFWGAVKLLGQIVVAGLMPERAVVSLYLLVRGIVKPKDLWPKVSVPAWNRMIKMLAAT